MSNPFGVGEVEYADDGGLPCAAFIYKYTHLPTGKWYIGMHGLKENEGPRDGQYLHSSKDPEFLELLEKEPENFKYQITHYGSMQEVFKLENKILTKLKAAADPLSWNKWNGFVYETAELPRLDLIDELATQAYDKNSGLERTIEKVKDLYNDVVKLQVRFDTEFAHKKISEYRNEMDAKNSTEGFTLTIVRRDGKKVLVGGNHTLQSGKLSRCTSIEVVWIDEDLTMEEMQALGTALNRKTGPVRMTATHEDVANALVTMYKKKKITDPTFKDAYATQYIKVTGNFVGKEISKVRKIANKTLAEENSWKDGKHWINWSVKKREIQKKNLATAITNDSILGITQSAVFRADRVIEKWIKDADTRKSLELSVRPNIKILMSYDTITTMNAYNKNGDQKGHKRILESFLRGEGIKNPIVTFENLEMWEDKIS